MNSQHMQDEVWGTKGTALVAGIWSDPYEAVSPSVYETARLVTLVPWLTGHSQRVRFLLERQHPDGTWGAAGGYCLVPTLSATEALLTCLRRKQNGDAEAAGHGDLVRATDRGLRALFGRLGRSPQILLPDTIAAEIVIPALVARINAHLDSLGSQPVTGLDVWGGTGRLLLPHGVDPDLLSRLRHAVDQGQVPPPKLLHSLEVLGPAARGAPFVAPVLGAVGCSPAATAAWLTHRTAHPSFDYLHTVQHRGGGPVPGITPITFFEWAWVLTALTTAGCPVRIPEGLVSSLHSAFDESGIPAAPGLPPDSDDTAAALCVLAELGSPRSPDCLFAYQLDTHFSCFPGERTPSISTNAHVLQAFGTCLGHEADGRARREAAITTISQWIRDRQDNTGSWTDKWHASAYYATVCCATALHRYDRDASAIAVHRAVSWLLESQHEDGSWGRWGGTDEETAYAVQTLVHTHADRPNIAAEQATARGYEFLRRRTPPREYPPLWHDKDLYAPIRVIQAEIVAARQLARSHPPVATLIRQRGAGKPRSAQTG
ncbi:MAG TPA: prenyltransferase/squalene oxidase repeat-containing protein [Pseudonocardiaceae bacterium]